MIMSLVTYTYDRFLAMRSDVLFKFRPVPNRKVLFSTVCRYLYWLQKFFRSRSVRNDGIPLHVCEVGFPEGVAFSADVECTHVHHIKKFLLWVLKLDLDYDEIEGFSPEQPNCITVNFSGR